MKLIIELDEKRFEDIQRIASIQIRRRILTCEQIIANGIPLEEELGNQNHLTFRKNSDVSGLKIAECSECNRRTWSGNCLLLDGQVKFVNFDYVPDDCPLKENKR